METGQSVFLRLTGVNEDQEKSGKMGAWSQLQGWGIRHIPLPILADANLMDLMSDDNQERLISFVGTLVAVEYNRHMAVMTVGTNYHYCTFMPSRCQVRYTRSRGPSVVVKFFSSKYPEAGKWPDHGRK